MTVLANLINTIILTIYITVFQTTPSVRNEKLSIKRELFYKITLPKYEPSFYLLTHHRTSSFPVQIRTTHNNKTIPPKYTPYSIAIATILSICCPNKEPSTK